jgi:hypothetical protein
LPFTYGFLWLNLFISVSVYSVDTFTAVNLLVFDRWSGKIKPAIPLAISRWIFAGCIILSFVLLFYRWLRAIRVMKGSGVAQSYLDPLAVRIQSVRMGKEGRGWKRFLVFAELTKSRKGADYVALFTFYSFEGKQSIPVQRMTADKIQSLDQNCLRRRTTSSHQRFNTLLCLTSGLDSRRQKCTNTWQLTHGPVL